MDLLVFLYIYIIVYGFAFGVRNFTLRIVAALQGRDFIQSGLGVTLDALWFTALVIASYVNGFLDWVVV